MKAITHSSSTAAIRAQQVQEIRKMESKNHKGEKDSTSSLCAKKPEQDQLRGINVK